MLLPTLFLLAGLLAGALVVWFFQESRHAGGRTRVALLDDQLAALRTELAAERQVHAGNAARLAAAEERARGLEVQAAEATERLRGEFENLANRVLEEKGTRFATQNQQNLDALLAPLSQKIGEFKTEVQRAREEDHRVRGRLEEQIRTVAVTGERMTREANTLASALKGSTKTQGNWGELILETVLQSCGLLRGEHYRVQENLTGEDGRTYRPDVIIQLPEGKHLIVDSKVSLTAYERWCRAAEANDESERTLAMRGHLESLRGHITGLGAKRYHALPGVESIELVLMFIPLEPALAIACGADRELLTVAHERNVCLVTPTTLLLALRTVASIWNQEKQARNTLDIAKKSGDLLDKFVGFCEDLQNVGQHLKKAGEAHEAALNKLSTGNGNLVRRAEELRKLGAKASKKLPAALADRAAGAGPDDGDGNTVGMLPFQ